MKKYRHFKFTTKDFEDYALVENLSSACDFYSKIYPGVRGAVKEFWMDEFSESKNPNKRIHDRGNKVVTIN